MKRAMPEDKQYDTAGTVLAFDFGEKRIGVAVGDWQLRQAHPLTIIHGEANAARFSSIAALIGEWQPASLVVGLPATLDGASTTMTARCIRFANQLRGRFALPVDCVDERLSSVEAEHLRRAMAHGSRRTKQQHLDAEAAQLILQSHFDGTAQCG